MSDESSREAAVVSPDSLESDPNSPIDFYFTLFYRPSWVYSRREHISYSGDMIWSIKSVLSLNRKKLASILDKCGIQNREIVIPLPETEKTSSRSGYNVYNARGEALELHPNEEGAYIALTIIEGCINRAKKYGMIGESFVLSEELAFILFEEFRKFAAPTENVIDYIEFSSKNLEEQSNKLKGEFDSLVAEVPGFASLVEFFVYHWLPIVKIDAENSAYDVLDIAYKEVQSLYTLAGPAGQTR
jgi:hypothetical protein